MGVTSRRHEEHSHPAANFAAGFFLIALDGMNQLGSLGCAKLAIGQASFEAAGEWPKDRGQENGTGRCPIFSPVIFLPPFSSLATPEATIALVRALTGNERWDRLTKKQAPRSGLSSAMRCRQIHPADGITVSFPRSDSVFVREPRSNLAPPVCRRTFARNRSPRRAGRVLWDQSPIHSADFPAGV